jgi:amino acid transporter
LHFTTITASFAIPTVLGWLVVFAFVSFQDTTPAVEETQKGIRLVIIALLLLLLPPSFSCCLVVLLQLLCINASGGATISVGGGGEMTVA